MTLTNHRGEELSFHCDLVPCKKMKVRTSSGLLGLFSVIGVIDKRDVINSLKISFRGRHRKICLLFLSLKNIDCTHYDGMIHCVILDFFKFFKHCLGSYFSFPSPFYWGRVEILQKKMWRKFKGRVIF